MPSDHTNAADPADGLVSFLCRHLVGLCVSYRHIPDDKDKPERFAACSGILIFIHNTLCFLTAGHVLKELDRLRTQANVKIESAVLADTFGAANASRMPIPYNLQNASLFYIDDDDEGLDFGVMLLEPHFGRLLAKNGMVALAEEQWAHQERIQFDRYALLGLPTELVSNRIVPGVGGRATAVMAFVTPTDAVPGRRSTRHPQFIAKLDGPHPRSVEGMSGGPIFGFRIDPQQNVRYWVVALQSSWDPPSRTIYATPLPILASMMTEWATDPHGQ